MIKSKFLKDILVTKKKLLYALASALLVAFLSYKFLFSSAGAYPPDIKVVESYQVTLKDITSSVRLIGTINAKNYSQMLAQEQGILHLIVDSGSSFKEGDLIAAIENKEIEKNYNLSVNAEKIAKDQFDRAKKLLQSGSYSKAEHEAYKNNFILAQKNLASAKIALDKLKVIAPFNGVVGHYKYKKGEQVQIGNKIVTLYNPNIIRIDFDIPSSVIDFVSNGQQVKVFDKVYNVKTVQKILDPETHMVSAFVELNCEKCVIGSTTYVDLALITKTQVIVIPFDAVFLKQGKNSVYVIKDGIVELKQVTLGIRDKEFVEIVKGIEVGDEIVSTSTSRLYPGARVKIYQEK